MSEIAYRLKSLDPLVFGDGRPFSPDAGATSLRGHLVPSPSTLAGGVRTAIGFAHQVDFKNPATLEALTRTEVRGPILTLNDEPMFATPADFSFVANSHGSVQAARAHPVVLEHGEGSDLEGLGLCGPTLLAGDTPTKERPPQFFSNTEMTEWLLGEERKPSRKPKLLPEDRVHVGIEFDRLSSKQGALFKTSGYRYGRYLSMGEDSLRGEACCPEIKGYDVELGLSLATDSEFDLSTLGAMTLGGERRLAVLREEQDDWWRCPAAIRERLGRANVKRIRLILATPAVFGNGLLPGWVRVPGTDVEVRILAATNLRRSFVSGWDLATRGPKAVRWLAPAGSAYFLEIVKGSAAALPDQWLRPVSDDPQSCRDGFGLALWGIW